MNTLYFQDPITSISFQPYDNAVFIGTAHSIHQLDLSTNKLSKSFDSDATIKFFFLS